MVPRNSRQLEIGTHRRICLRLDAIAVLRSSSRSTSTRQWWQSSPGAWSKRQRCWRKSERTFQRNFQDCACARVAFPSFDLFFSGEVSRIVCGFVYSLVKKTNSSSTGLFFRSCVVALHCAGVFVCCHALFVSARLPLVFANLFVRLPLFVLYSSVICPVAHRFLDRYPSFVLSSVICGVYT